MADSLPDPDAPWINTPELVAFRAAAKACYLAGEDYKTLKEIIATEDELTPLEMRKIDPDDVSTFSEQLVRYQTKHLPEVKP
jgi:hypothetical protein